MCLPLPRPSMASGDYTLSDFDFELPPDRIAQTPPAERTGSRLLHVDGETLADRRFRDLPALFRAGDLLVFNDTRVMKSRLVGTKSTGGRVELLLERVLSRRRGAVPDPCQPRARVRGSDRRFRAASRRPSSGATTDSSGCASPAWRRLPTTSTAHGEVPLPPYIDARADRCRRSPLPDRVCPPPRGGRRADGGTAFRRAAARRAAAARRRDGVGDAARRRRNVPAGAGRRPRDAHGCMPSGIGSPPRPSPRSSARAHRGGPRRRRRHHQPARTRVGRGTGRAPAGRRGGDLAVRHAPAIASASSTGCSPISTCPGRRC